MTAKKTAFSFEKALDSLETIVNSIEKGDISLEESLKQFETGIQLTQSCHKALSEAEQKVKQLMKDNEKESVVTFEKKED